MLADWDRKYDLFVTAPTKPLKQNRYSGLMTGMGETPMPR
jgi:hypothetical protein